ncbi:MAG: tRNA uridine(34) 5-carboxymethylaminomethyl modification radical SAM/GNAT enzyme Elp3 [Holophagales bacterium]|nr:tRNA uridine(34) 5-carboxymethylaminomethyl modification radical SAM/GNAT enzyme Elp3 [Holophagales bacterium]MYG31731.1 tRNA uridine(34) 5-carboxymethylaminomethyl modification radical SAM/GNAT enzyme Elp3 [Holophagales bacterium]MYI79573.1 tRNA uridine(34) 5-carboxymethylaminomethyl modification radical SAM/GNAT enzyme Elp3 [Holophagales bacterium]
MAATIAPKRFSFEPEEHAAELDAIIGAIESASRFEARDLDDLLRRHPKNGRGFFSKSELIRGYRALRPDSAGEQTFVDRVRMKPVRTRSGVAPVTVLTKPFPCPGRCIFCPSDVRMPKSYLSSEPGAQRAAEHQFDPYRQTLSRLRSYRHTGHPVDKVELIVLGGTWSSYPEGYQVWFILRCLQAMNEFVDVSSKPVVDPLLTFAPAVDFRHLEETVRGAEVGPSDAAASRSYNQVVSDWTAAHPRAAAEARKQNADWADLLAAQRKNETSTVRCVGLSLETRPDRLDAAEALRMRRLGATKVQIGIQSMDDDVLALNGRGHDTARSRRAVRLLRQAGFKIQAHWMPNLHGSTPARDREDFDRLFADPDVRPDELKVYPCSLIESAELMAYHRRGEWLPYETDELLDVLVHGLGGAPRYCRLSRVIRDIPGTDIVTGNRTTNLRQVAEVEASARGIRCRDIRAREVGGRPVDPRRLRLRRTDYGASGGRETFLEFVTANDRIAGFLRLHMPGQPATDDISLPELANRAIIREVHVYGAVVSLGEREEGRSQHVGLGRRLIAEALDIAAGAGFGQVAVISSVGTREYYRRLGFEDGELYQHRSAREPLETPT